ncbi:MAG TPA: DUF177 domain-containing protein [Candidatus Limnocylindria bacterium]|nr:DUF177 domain-containing protein [Candidatus Limnocylindria bacterium]
MQIKVNLRLLEKKPALLEGEVAFEELAPGVEDELIHVAKPVSYWLEAQRQPQGVHVAGRLETVLRCECARCLQSFDLPLVLDAFEALGVTEGEEALVRDGDFADLTPLVREEILLALPTHPLCKVDCHGLPQKQDAREGHFSASPSSSPVWGPLDQLKL